MKAGLLSGRSAGGGGVDPINSAIWHVDFSDPASYTDAGSGSISEVIDLTGTQADLTQATSANRPTLQSAAYNGLNCARFDGTNDHLFSTSPFLSDILSVGSGELDLWVVLKALSSQADAYWLAQGNSGSSNTVFGFSRATANADFFNRTSGGSNSSVVWSGTAAGAFDHTADLRVLRFQLDVAGPATLTTDGGTSEDETWTYLTSAADRMALGALIRNTTGLYMNMDLCEIRLWDGFLSTEDADTTEAELATKWGVTI